MEWIKDNFKITMFEDSEVAVLDKWQLRVSKLKNLKNLGIITKSLIENLNEKEREILSFKIIDSDQEDEYVWSISTTGKFNSISGSAKTKEQAKDLAERSLKLALILDDELNANHSDDKELMRKSAHAFDQIVQIFDMHGADPSDVIKQVEILWDEACERSRDPYR